VGFAFGRGQINAGSSKVNAVTKAPEGPFDWTLRPQTTESPAAGSMEDALDQLDLDAYAMAPADIEAFRQPLRMREIGAAVVENLSQFTQNQVVPADVFDLLVYFREVQPSRLLGTTA
jgi:erythromycin esterase-like protein